MSAPIRILYLTPADSFFGSERSLLETIKGLDRSAFKPMVVVPAGYRFRAAFEKAGALIEEVELIPFGWLRALGTVARVNRALIRLTHQHRANVVHVNLLPPSLVPYAPWFAWLRWRGIPLVFHLRLDFWCDIPTRWILFRSQIVCVSQAVRRRLLVPRRSDFLTRPHAQRVHALYSACNLAAFHPDGSSDGALRQELGLNGERVVGIVGAIERIKRQDLFLRAAREIKDRYPNVKFLIVGDPWNDQPQRVAYKREVYALCRELGLERDVIFTGYRHDVPRFMRLMDVIVMTSRREAMANVLIEAMASGTPVVSSAVESACESVEDGTTGFLIEPSDAPSAYAQKIIALLDDDALRARMGQAGVARAARFDRSVIVPQFEAFYHMLLKQRESA